MRRQISWYKRSYSVTGRRPRRLSLTAYYVRTSTECRTLHVLIVVDVQASVMTASDRPRACDDAVNCIINQPVQLAYVHNAPSHSGGEWVPPTHRHTVYQYTGRIYCRMSALSSGNCKWAKRNCHFRSFCIQGEHKKVTPCDFVNISTQCTFFHAILHNCLNKQQNIHFTTSFGWNT